MEYDTLACDNISKDLGSGLFPPAECRLRCIFCKILNAPILNL